MGDKRTVTITSHGEHLTTLQKNYSRINLHLEPLLQETDALVLVPYGWDLNEERKIPHYLQTGYESDLNYIQNTAWKRQNFIALHTGIEHPTTDLKYMLDSVRENTPSLEVLAAGMPLRMLEQLRTNTKKPYHTVGKKWFERSNSRKTFGQRIGQKAAEYMCRELPKTDQKRILAVVDATTEESFVQTYQRLTTNTNA